MLSNDCYSAEPSLTSLDVAVATALQIADEVSGAVLMDTLYAAGRILVSDVISPIPLPPFDHSAMDGYAAAVPETGSAEGDCYTLKGRSVAGDDSKALPALVTGETYRVFTGAPLPPGANAVIMQEHCTVAPHGVRFSRQVKPGDNIRRASEDIQQGELVLEAGTKLDPRHIAVLSAMGVAKVRVRRKLRVGIFTTGSELVEPGSLLQPGKIYDSNKSLLTAALKRPGLEVEDYGRSGDDVSEIKSRIAACAPSVDLMLTTGSAGGSDTDLLLHAFEEAGGTAKLVKLAMKPGKPCLMGRIGTTMFLGLPGNPVAALVTFLMIGEAVIARQLGASNGKPTFIKVKSATRYRHVRGKAEFVPARIQDQDSALPVAEILGKGGSARYLPLLMADGLCMIQSDMDHVEVGETLSFLSFKSLSWN